MVHIRSGIVRFGDTQHWAPDSNGLRRWATVARFEPAFTVNTGITAIVSIQGIDAEKNANLRVALETYQIEASGMTIRATVWADTRIFSLDVMWLAYFGSGTS
jgi:hypothetical protein